MNALTEYGLFLAKILTLVIAALFLIAGMIAVLSRGKNQEKGRLKIKNLNKKYEDIIQDMNEKVLSKKNYKLFIKAFNKKSKNADKNTENKPHSKRIYVLNFDGDIRASAVDNFREEITAVLSIATVSDEVVVRLESAGGMVHSYGLGASQLQRIKDKKIPLTVIVDKVAASGGYLMACVADKILAAPFAIIGSIGVVAQLPNFNRLLKKNNIDFEQITAGEYKRTLTVFGENTEKAREKMKEELEEIHEYFKYFLAVHRPQLNIEQIATGEHWLAAKALELKLIDKLQTSDDYLFSLYPTADIIEISYFQKKTFSNKLLDIFSNFSNLSFLNGLNIFKSKIQ